MQNGTNCFVKQRVGENGERGREGGMVKKQGCENVTEHIYLYLYSRLCSCITLVIPIHIQ